MSVPAAEHAAPVGWASGSAYDLFASLFVIHHAEATGLRKAWAAGVRNRLVPEHRELLQLLVPIVAVPVKWIGRLDDSPDAAAVISALQQLPDDRVLSQLGDPDFVENPTIARIRKRGSFTGADLASLQGDESLRDYRPSSEGEARRLLEAFAHQTSSGALLKSALGEYYERFFAEEEARVEPYLAAALNEAQQKARTMSLVDLVDELTSGLRLENIAEARRLLFIPSFWAGPLTLFEMLADGTWVILFSARPRDVAIIPGDQVPDALVRSLSAVSDQTRLRILRLLASTPHSQVEIARELRLRPPTITHHLKILRLANLVQLTETVEGEKRYATRTPRLDELGADLVSFVTDS